MSVLKLEEKLYSPCRFWGRKHNSYLGLSDYHGPFIGANAKTKETNFLVYKYEIPFFRSVVVCFLLLRIFLAFLYL